MKGHTMHDCVYEASLRYLPSLKLRHDKKLRLGKPEGEGRVFQGMSVAAAR